MCSSDLQLLSFTPAVALAPLLARGLFHLLKYRAGWDQGFDTSDDLLATLRWCVEAVPLYNGTRMLRRGAALQLRLAGDASEVRAEDASRHSPASIARHSMLTCRSLEAQV